MINTGPIRYKLFTKFARFSTDYQDIFLKFCNKIQTRQFSKLNLKKIQDIYCDYKHNP